jgi:hypothetical protein
MQLSILIATNRKGLPACSRIAQACSWASPDIEVIIRDNSGDAQKREFLAHCRRDYCTIEIAEPCDILTNFWQTLRLATGEFVFLLADDDFSFDHAIVSISAMLGTCRNDPSVAGVTGGYVVETSQGSSILNYQNVESDDVTARVAGFLSYRGPNILHYAPIRRELVARIFGFVGTMPALFSFHDQIICLLYLLCGKFIRLKRLMYGYDVGVWENPETAQKRDVDFYREAGYDPAINALHWLLCGFEGAALVRNADVFPDFPLSQRQIIADWWFSAMFARFKVGGRLTYESRFAGEASVLCAKLQGSTGQLSFQDLLREVCDFIALFSKPKSQSYYDFWNGVINKPKAAPQLAEFPVELRGV